MRGKWLTLLGIYILSVIVRIYPIFITPVPYNVDALLDSRASQFIATHGNLNFPQGVSYNNHHTPVTILFNALSGAISQLVGIPVLHLIPLIFPFLTSISVLGWYLLSKKITGREEVALMTAAFFAVSGTYVLQTALVWKEAIGFIIMPFSLYAYRKRSAVSIFLLAILPLTHHYVALLTYMILTYSEAYNLYIKYKSHIPLERKDYLWPVAIGALWMYMSAYYSITHFNRLSNLSPSGQMWLFLALFVLLFLSGLRVLNARYKKINLKIVVLISIIPSIIYVTYFFFPVFSHTMLFNGITFAYTFGYILLIPFIATGMYILSTAEHKERRTFISLLLAPIQMILFFMLQGFDPVSYASVSRTYDFLDPSTHTSLATGVYKTKRKALSFAVVFLILATTTPLAYHTTEAFGVTYFIYPDELHAARWIKENFNTTILTDDKLGLVAHNGFDINASRNLPYLIKNGFETKEKIWLIGDYWNNGAQMSPMAPISVNVTRILQQNSVLFSSGHTFVVLNNTS